MPGWHLVGHLCWKQDFRLGLHLELGLIPLAFLVIVLVFLSGSLTFLLHCSTYCVMELRSFDQYTAMSQ